MKFELKKTYDQQKAMEYLNKLIKAESKCEVKKLHPKRSTSQNSYLHVLFALWSKEFGYTMDESKQTVKTELGYCYRLTELKFTTEFYCKTSEMDSKELTIFIEKFRDWSADTCGLYLPSPDEYLLEQIHFDNLIDN